ncbi:MAG TPA: YncE family protein [Puia sp.]|nr:YncE family protein [Puia sp.]
MKRYLSLICLLLFNRSISGQTTPPVTDINKACYKTIEVRERPDFIAVQENYAWVIDDNNSLIKRLSVDHTKPLIAIKVPAACAAPVIAFEAVWVISCAEGSLYKIDKNTGRILTKIAVGIADPHGEMSLAAGDRSVWLLSDSSGVLTRINPRTNRVEATIRVNPHSYCAGYGYNAVWVTSTGESTVQKIDVQTNTVVATIPVGKNPRFISVGSKGIWTLNQGEGTVSRIDAATNKVTATIDVHAKGGGGDIAEDGSKVWVVSTNTNRPVQVINTTNNEIEAIYGEASETGKDSRVDGAVRASGKYIWVSGLYRQKVWVFKKI